MSAFFRPFLPVHLQKMITRERQSLPLVCYGFLSLFEKLNLKTYCSFYFVFPFVYPALISSLILQLGLILGLFLSLVVIVILGHASTLFTADKDVLKFLGLGIPVIWFPWNFLLSCFSFCLN